MNDLWPESLELVKPEPEGPVTILEEQAALLGKKTKNLVTAEVGVPSQFKGEIQYPFYLVAPQLNNYRYLLFSISYGILSSYPVNFLLDEEIVKEIQPQNSRFIISANSDLEFVDLLKKVLQSAKTRQLINSLRTRSNQFITRTAKTSQPVGLGQY